MTIKSETKGAIARKYGVTIPTFNKWLLVAGIISEDGLFTKEQYLKTRVLTPKQIEVIYKALGTP